MLADKISGVHVGLWLLIPEHLRLGTWELLMAWTGIHDVHAVEPRLALQLIHESALCINGMRHRKTLRQKGFETLNGLPFVAADSAIHNLLNRHTVGDALMLQKTLGLIRQSRGHYPGNLVLIDPHRIGTWSKRQMPPKKAHSTERATKVMQTFFAIDGISNQPLAFILGSSTVTVTQATMTLLDQVATILPEGALLVGDSEHFTYDLLNSLVRYPHFSVLIPIPRYKHLLKSISSMRFTPLWAGYAVTEAPYQRPDIGTPLRLVVQRTGETNQTYEYKPFVTTSTLPPEHLMSLIYPERWNIEEFFRMECPLGWNRASTFNLNIRLGKLSMALIAQAAIHQLRQKLPQTMRTWAVESIARKLFSGIDGDIRVNLDTIVVTLYNAPYENIFKEHYEHLPEKLQAQKINPKIPWLYDFKVDFRFK